jgi:P27 family predicted phage terminase small subunit
MTGPAPRPAALKLLEGRGHGRDSGGREVKAIPGFKRIPPTKPADLAPDAEALWDLVIDEFTRLNLLKQLDGAALEITCATYARWKEADRKCREEGTEIQGEGGWLKRAPWLLTAESASKEFRAYLAEFGLSPSAEGRLSALSRLSDPNSLENDELFG